MFYVFNNFVGLHHLIKVLVLYKQQTNTIISLKQTVFLE